MNAPLPESIRLALEKATLDDRSPCERRQSHNYAVGCAAEHGGLGVERLCAEEN